MNALSSSSSGAAKTTRQRGPRNRRADRRVVIALWILAFLAILVMARFGRSVLIPLVLSVLVSYALEPLVGWLAHRRVPRSVGAIIATTSMVALLGGVAYALSDDALRLIEQLPDSVQRIRRQLVDTSATGGGFVERLQRAVGAIQEAAEAARTGRVAQPAVAAPTPDYLVVGSTQLVALATHAVVVVFLVLFLLWSGDLYRRKLLRIAGTLARREIAIEVLEEIEARIKRFLIVRVVTGVIVAIGTWVALAWLGLQNAALWGVVAGVCNSIPYLGPVIVSGGVAIVALMQFGSVAMAAYASGLALLITSLEGWLLDPLLMGKAERMNAVAILVGLSVWTALWGAWGALLAVPMLAVIKAVCDHVTDLKPIGELLGE